LYDGTIPDAFYYAVKYSSAVPSRTAITVPNDACIVSRPTTNTIRKWKGAFDRSAVVSVLFGIASLSTSL
jgi:hypothetical protein